MTFYSTEEQMLIDEFMEIGLVKVPVQNMKLLNWFKNIAQQHCDMKLDEVHREVKPQDLNAFRMKVRNAIIGDPNTRSRYYNLASNALNAIVGNELVMQRQINLSIQMPGDESSLLPIHCDTWSGDSPYEVVLWVPLVDCYDTKSMFYSDPKSQPRLAGKTTEQLYAECKPWFVDCKYGECLIFSQNIMHGNRVNKTKETRWSMNCRFKSALSPYADKQLGEFFEPITLRPATRLGMEYEFPNLI